MAAALAAAFSLSRMDSSVRNADDRICSSPKTSLRIMSQRMDRRSVPWKGSSTFTPISYTPHSIHDRKNKTGPVHILKSLTNTRGSENNQIVKARSV
eukprot:scaffold3195_cov162-Amphora_coffeaeformis.AAC.9